jgi:thiamine pyrophosphokinase
MTAIVHSSETVTLVGAGLATENSIRRCLSLAPKLIAADGGATICFDAGLTPEAVIGDLDSLGALPDLANSVVHQIAEQDSTDFDKALRSIEAPLVLGTGFTGLRVDHYLACLNTLVRRPDRRCILLGESDIAFLLPPHFQMDLASGTRVSLFPMGLVEGTSDGLKWPISGLSFAPDGQVGTSNEAEGAIEISVTAPKLLMILPEAELEAATEALLRCSSTWPALDR